MDNLRRVKFPPAAIDYRFFRGMKNTFQITHAYTYARTHTRTQCAIAIYLIREHIMRCDRTSSRFFRKSVHVSLFSVTNTVTHTCIVLHEVTHIHRLSIFYFEMHPHIYFVFDFLLLFSRYFCPWRLLYPVQQVRGSLPKI